MMDLTRFDAWLEENKWRFKEDALFDLWQKDNFNCLYDDFSEDYRFRGSDDDFYDWAREQFEERITELFDEAQTEGCDQCDNCPFNEATTDAFGTGDSPTAFECTSFEPSDCEFVLDNLDINDPLDTI